MERDRININAVAACRVLEICFIGIGSNLKGPKLQVRRAITSLSNYPDIILQQQSSLYITKPVGYLNQPDFINAVVKIATSLPPLELLRVLQAIEIQQGRERDAKLKYGPRTIDLDLLLYGKHEINLPPELTVPHPRMWQRDFVLRPLAELVGGAPVLSLQQ